MNLLTIPSVTVKLQSFPVVSACECAQHRDDEGGRLAVHPHCSSLSTVLLGNSLGKAA